MKKLRFLALVAGTMAFTACGGGNSETSHDDHADHNHGEEMKEEVVMEETTVEVEVDTVMMGDSMEVDTTVMVEETVEEMPVEEATEEATEEMTEESAH